MVQVGGLILCGGRSRRMGRAKEWLPISGETMLQRIVRLVGRSCAQPVAVAAGEGQSLPDLPPYVTILQDSVADQGPLHPLVQGLQWFDGRVEWVYVTATDCPFLQAGWIDRLVQLAEGFDLVIPEIGRRRYPLNALYRTSLYQRGGQLEGAGVRAVGQLAELVKTKIATEIELSPVDPKFLSLTNINHPEDYDRALERFARGRFQPGEPRSQ